MYSTKNVTQLPSQTTANTNSVFVGGFNGSNVVVSYTADSIDNIIPPKATEIQITSSGNIPDLTVPQQNQIKKGAIVALSNGSLWMYSGTGSKTLATSYVSLTDDGTW